MATILKLLSTGNLEQEGFSSTFRRGEIQLRANNEQSAAQALTFWQRIQSTNHFGDFLGVAKPRFPMRALLAENSLPTDEQMCSWGFNTLIFNNEFNGGLFYRSKLTSDYDPNKTTGERMLVEIKELEKEGRKLIYVLPTHLQEMDWVWSVIEDVAPETILAFDAEINDQPHPLWSSMRQRPFTSVTPLMAILPPNKINFISQCHRHNFKGFIIIYKGLEDERDLWIAGQAQWWNLEPTLLLETWNKIIK